MEKEAIKLEKKLPLTKEIEKLKDALLLKKDDFRFVGGCVRNFMMDIPLSDIDIACKHEPEKVMELLKNKGIKAIPTGIEHGTITAVINHIPFEITSLRKDINCDGRRATVSFTKNYKEDAERRDFTFNAMSISADGEYLYDYFNGLDDIKNGTVRFIGEAEDRIREDYLRILRFFRFFCYYGKMLDDEGLEACIKLKEGLQDLSGERIKTEMFKILKHPNADEVLEIMQYNKILQEVLPIEKLARNTLENSRELDKLLNKEYEKYTLNPVFILALASSRTESSHEFPQKIKASWRLSNQESKLLKNILMFNNLDKILLGGAGCNIKSDCLTHNIKRLLLDFDRELLIYGFLFNLSQNFDEYKGINVDLLRAILKLIQELEAPILPVNGNDIISLGIKEGKEVHQYLSLAKKYWIDSDFQATKEDFMLYLRGMIDNNK